MVNKALEVLAILSYHPVVREALIAHDVIVFVRLFKKYVMSRNGANRDLLLEIFSSIVKQALVHFQLFPDLPGPISYYVDWRL